jgi:hypothetical protein
MASCSKLPFEIKTPQVKELKFLPPDPDDNDTSILIGSQYDTLDGTLNTTIGTTGLPGGDIMTD